MAEGGGGGLGGEGDMNLSVPNTMSYSVGQLLHKRTSFLFLAFSCSHITRFDNIPASNPAIDSRIYYGHGKNDFFSLSVCLYP